MNIIKYIFALLLLNMPFDYYIHGAVKTNISTNTNDTFRNDFHFRKMHHGSGRWHHRPGDRRPESLERGSRSDHHFLMRPPHNGPRDRTFMHNGPENRRPESLERGGRSDHRFPMRRPHDGPGDRRPESLGRGGRSGHHFLMRRPHNGPRDRTFMHHGLGDRRPESLGKDGRSDRLLVRRRPHNRPPHRRWSKEENTL